MRRVYLLMGIFTGCLVATGGAALWAMRRDHYAVRHLNVRAPVSARQEWEDEGEEWKQRNAPDPTGPPGYHLPPIAPQYHPCPACREKAASIQPGGTLDCKMCGRKFHPDFVTFVKNLPNKAA